MTAPDTNDVAAGFPEISDEDLAQVIYNFANNFKRFKDLWGITSQEMEAVYGLGYQTYAAGGYEQALKIFRFLCYYDHLNFKYWLGLGGCCQMLGRYKAAVEAYTLAMLLDSDDPRPPLRAAQCHIALGNRDAAISGLTAALEWAGDQPEHRQARDQADELMRQLQSGDPAGPTKLQQQEPGGSAI